MDIIELRMPLWGENQDLPDPELLLLYKGFKDRNIWLDTEITLDNCSLLVKYIQNENLDYEKNGDDRPIVIHIASPGGDLSTMFMLYHTLRNSKIPIHTINEGGAHSAAFLVFLAGDKRTMTPDATFVAHEGSNLMGGTFKESRMAMKQYEREVLRMKSLICERTKFTMEELDAAFEKESDFYINGDIAIKKGVVTEEW